MPLPPVDTVEGNIEHLKMLFPEAVTEGKVDFEVLKQLLGGAVDEREEKYSINWYGKKAREAACARALDRYSPSASRRQPGLGQDAEHDDRG